MKLEVVSRLEAVSWRIAAEGHHLSVIFHQKRHWNDGDSRKHREIDGAVKQVE